MGRALATGGRVGGGGVEFFFSSIDFFVSQMEITCWDWLPFEVQEKITELRLAQQAIDAEKQRLQRNVIKEIQAYGALKEAWKLGHIQLKVRQCNTVCQGAYHLKIMGCYIDEEHCARQVFLGYDFPNPLRRIEHVKSFLFYR